MAERTEMTGKTAKTEYDQWDRQGNALSLTVGQDVSFAEYGETVNPLRDFQAFSKQTKMLREMGVPDVGVLKEQLAWCHLDSTERLASGNMGYMTSFCQPKDANFVLIRQLVRSESQIVGLGSQLPRDFVGLENTLVFEDAAYGDTLTERVIFAPLDYYAKHIKADVWRNEAQKEFESWRKDATASVSCDYVKRAASFIRKLSDLEERLLDLDWDWAKDLEEVSLGLAGKPMKLPDDWQTSLKYYPNCQSKLIAEQFSWLGKLYYYDKENINYVEECVIAIESAVSKVRRNQTMRQKYLAAAQANRISYTVFDASGKAEYNYVPISLRCEKLHINFYPSKARLYRIADGNDEGRHLGDFVYFNKEGAAQTYEAFLATLDRTTEKKINVGGWLNNVVGAIDVMKGRFNNR